MELSQEMVTTAKPMTVNHENSKLYSMLKQCMANNAELHQDLLTAAEIIDQLTQRLREKDES
jgi:hypothetical protein